MDRVALRVASKLTYRDPAAFLVRLRSFENKIAQAPISEPLRHLRTNRLKPLRELREAAIFCHFMGQRIGTTVSLAPGESQDYDFMASWQQTGTLNFAPVQIKELVPAYANAAADFEQLLAGLKKYRSSPELIVAVHINREVRFDPRTIDIPPLPIAELWAFGARSPDQDNWVLWGNLLQSPEGTSHVYPTDA